MVCNFGAAQWLKPSRNMSDPGSHRFATGKMSLETLHRKRAIPGDTSRRKCATGNMPLENKNLFLHAKPGKRKIGLN